MLLILIKVIFFGKMQEILTQKYNDVCKSDGVYKGCILKNILKL